MSGTPQRIGAGAPANPLPPAHPPESSTPPGTSATPRPGPAAFGELPARTSQAASAPRAAWPAAGAASGTARRPPGPPYEEIDAFVDSLHAMAPMTLDPAPAATAGAPRIPRVPSEEVLQVLLDTARGTGEHELARQNRAYQTLRNAAAPGPSPVERMHNAINTLPHGIHPGLSATDRALLYQGAAVSGIADLAETDSNVSKAAFARAYLRAANLMPADPDTRVRSGRQNAPLHAVALLPQADQAMYMQVLPQAELGRQRCQRLRETMKAYFELTGNALSSDLCDAAGGPTFADRAQSIADQLHAAGKHSGGLRSLAAYLDAHPDAAPASGPG